jgi:hypothetical protein
VPLPSAREATVIGMSGSVTPGLAAAIFGSFQRLISPMKMAG